MVTSGLSSPHASLPLSPAPRNEPASLSLGQGQPSWSLEAGLDATRLFSTDQHAAEAGAVTAAGWLGARPLLQAGPKARWRRWSVVECLRLVWPGVQVEIDVHFHGIYALYLLERASGEGVINC